jgi:pimeloyl-ACP methyl ester carboxylesterase
MVGHSIGSHIIRLYAAEHPEAVAGLVLVDAAHEEQDLRRQHLVEPTLFGQLQSALSANAEGLDLDATASQVRTARRAAPLRPMPLVVLTAGTPDDPSRFPSGWPMEAEAQLHQELQTDLDGLTLGGRQVIAEQSTHTALAPSIQR